jgi:hypothetical protein
MTISSEIPKLLIVRPILEIISILTTKNNIIDLFFAIFIILNKRKVLYLYKKNMYTM